MGPGKTGQSERRDSEQLQLALAYRVPLIAVDNLAGVHTVRRLTSTSKLMFHLNSHIYLANPPYGANYPSPLIFQAAFLQQQS